MISKKGTIVDLVLMPVFTTVIVLGFILLSILATINGLHGDLQPEKASTAINSGLLTIGLHDLTGNIDYIYSNKHNFSFDFQDNKILVYTKKKDKSDAITYSFAEDGSLGRLTFIPKTLNFTNKTIRELHFVKQGNVVFVDSPVVNKKFKANLDLLECSREKTTALKKDIILDPALGWDKSLEKEGVPAGEKGYMNQRLQITESDVNRILAARLFGYGKDFFAEKAQHTRSLSQDSKVDLKEKINKIQKSKGNAVISLRLGSYDDTDFNPVVAYINGESNDIKASRKLACRILNSLSSKLPEITDIAIVPVSISQLDNFYSKSPKRVLLKDKIGLQLVIGNVQIGNKNMIVEKQDDIARAIYDGIKAY